MTAVLIPTPVETSSRVYENPARMFLIQPIFELGRLRLKRDGARAETTFRRNGRVHLNRRGRQFIRLLAAVVCASA
jgi:hypothetical protein